MIGIPPINTPDFNTFSISFWAALYSGLIYSLFTGIIVGLVIWSLQRLSEKRLQHQKYEEDFLKVEEKLRHVNFDTDVLTITSAANSVPSAANEILTLFEGSPLNEWRKVLHRYKSIIKRIIDIQRQKNDFDLVAGKLDFHLRQFIRKYHCDKDIDAVNDYSHIAHFIGRIHGRSYAQLKQWLNSGNESSLNESYEAAQKCVEIQNRVGPYMEARAQLLKLVKVLKDDTES